MNLPLRFALRYLFARKSHHVINIISGISVAGMAIGTAALVIILSVFNGFNGLVRSTLGDVQPDLLVQPAAGKVFIPDQEAFRWAYDQEDVYTMSSILEEQVFLAYDGKQSLARVKGVDTVYEEESPLQEHIIEGQFLLHRGTRPTAVVGADLAWSLGIHPRFTAPLELYFPDRTGTFSPAQPMNAVASTRVMPAGLVALNTDVDADLVIVPIETMRTLLGYDEEVSAVEIRIRPGTSDKALSRLSSELARQLGPSFRVLDRYHQNEALYKMMRYEKLAIYLILLFVVIIIAFNIFSSLTMLIIEKEGDIETLRSLGAPERTVRRIFLLEGWLISLVGLAAGLVVGIGFVLLQQQFGLVHMPGNFVVNAYPVTLKASDILFTAVGVALVGYLIALLPSRHQPHRI